MFKKKKVTCDFCRPSISLNLLSSLCIESDKDRARYQSSIASVKKNIDTKWVLVAHFEKKLAAANSKLVDVVTKPTAPGMEVECDLTAKITDAELAVAVAQAYLDKAKAELAEEKAELAKEKAELAMKEAEQQMDGAKAQVKASKAKLDKTS